MKLNDNLKIASALTVLMAVFCVSCHPGTRRESDSDSVRMEVSDLTQDARAWADLEAAKMDTVRLAAQVLMPALYSSDDYWTLRQVREYGRRGFGGVVLLKGDSKGVRRLVSVLDSASAVAPFVAIDAEWGLGMRLSDGRVFPVNGEIGVDVDDQLMYDYGREVARECRNIGVNMVLGPVLDVSSDNQRGMWRRFKGDAKRVADLGLSYARGLEDGNVVSVSKHFPGLGSVGEDTHRRKGVVSRSLHELDSVDLAPFRMLVKMGLTGVMVGHTAVPAIDEDMYPAAVSPTVIRDLLQGDIGFRGLVLTDAMNMGGAEGYGADRALKAGAHIVVAPADSEEELERIVAAVRSGELTLSELRERVSDILFVKYLFRDGDGDIEVRDEYPDPDTLATRLGGKN